jgi:hypothetical protein
MHLFDQGTPAPPIPFLERHTVTKAKDAGWDKLVNGELLKAAGEAGFEVLTMTDKNMVAQQNLKGRGIAIVVLGNSQWGIVQRYVRRLDVGAKDFCDGKRKTGIRFERDGVC